MPSCGSRPTASPTACARWASAPGDRVFVLAGRIAPLYVAVLGSLKNGSVVTPLFSAFGPEPIATRVGIGEAQVLVTTEALYRRKIERMRERLPSLQHVILVGEGGAASAIPGTLDYDAWMSRASDSRPVGAHRRPRTWRCCTSPAAPPARPKGAMHVHGAALTHFATGRYALDLHDDDMFWCTADPGWVTGTSLRHHRAAAARRDQHRRRGRVRRRALVPHRCRTQEVTRLVHRADGDPHADEGRRRAGAQATTCRRCASSPASASR